MRIRHIVSVLLLAGPAAAMAQSPQPLAYPQNYFRNPLNIPIFLAGNFGECRPGHFHSGIDIKTQGRENLPVHAAADGYIARIKMEKGGFGHALYIVHPNGYTTLYAHLNKLAPELQSYLRQEQYKHKRWDVDLNLAPGQFPVKKGDQIAWSGNTGGSTAPHLHFEIRDTKTEHPLNPELFGLPIVDKEPPVPTEVAIYLKKLNSIYGSESVLMGVKKESEVYAPTKLSAANDQSFRMTQDTVYTPDGIIGIGINVNDYMDGSESTLAHYIAKLYMDDSLQAQVTLDNIGYDETRYINAYADYTARHRAHKWIQCLFQLPGNKLAIYSNLNNKRGWLSYPNVDASVRSAAPASKADMQPHKIDIIIIDDKGNESKVRFYLAPIKNPIDKIPFLENMGRTFEAGKINSFRSDNVSFSLDESQLYDNVQFDASEQSDGSAYSTIIRIGSPDIPVHHYFDLNIRPNKVVAPELAKKIVMMYADGKDTDGRAPVMAADGWYKAKVRNFGTYWLGIDTTAPEIVSMQRNGAHMAGAKQVAFDVKDDKTSVRSFSGFLDGKWICFESHVNSYFYEFDEHCPKGKHELIFKAEDENGNEAVYHLSFTR